MSPIPGITSGRARRLVRVLAGAALLGAAPVGTTAADNGGAADFHRAVRLADAGAVRAWLAQGGSPDVPNRSGRPALHVAVRYGHVELVGDLIDAGADVNARDADGWTALHHAAAGNAPVITERLLAAGAEVDLADPYRYTALHVAARSGHEVVCGRLLDAGADAGRRIDVGFTPADLASERFPDLAERLRSAAAP